MPELPEVETIVRALRDGGRDGQPIPGNEISSAGLLWPGCLNLPETGLGLDVLAGQKVRTVARRGKFIRILLSDYTILVHLRMSGDMRVEEMFDSQGELKPYLKHDRFVLNFTNLFRLVFNDVRKFGRVWLVSDEDPILKELGPEPLFEELTAEMFYELLKSRNRQLKPLLMDQHFLAGVGNIYSDEALFEAGLHPLSISSNLDQTDARRLLKSLRSVLEEGIARNGSSIDWVYRGGEFQNTFRVYQRTGKECFNCGKPVQRIIVGQRSTHFCPVCQKIR